MLAAEAVWGAAIQGMAAVSHAQGPTSGRHPQQERFIINLSHQYNLTPALGVGFRIARDRLHNHFYTGLLNAERLAEHLENGRIFVRQLLDIAGENFRERGD